MKLYEFKKISGLSDIGIYDKVLFTSKELCCKYFAYQFCNEIKYCELNDNKIIFENNNDKYEYSIKEINIKDKDINYVVYELEKYEGESNIGYASSLSKAINMVEKELLLSNITMSEIQILEDTIYFSNNNFNKKVIIKPIVFDIIESYFLYPNTNKEITDYYDIDFSRV